MEGSEPDAHASPRAVELELAVVIIVIDLEVDDTIAGLDVNVADRIVGKAELAVEDVAIAAERQGEPRKLFALDAGSREDITKTVKAEIRAFGGIDALVNCIGITASEPLFAASIVATGVLRGSGDTMIPSLFNLVSMWLVRLPLATLLSPKIGLVGVWSAMAIELSVRGILFLWRLSKRNWSTKEVIIAHS